MTPIERAARALGVYDSVPCIDGRDGCPGGVACPANAREAAYAVFQAIREPSETMISAANSAPGKPTHAVSSGLWVRMIDAALAEGI